MVSMSESENILYLFGYSINNYKRFDKLVNIIFQQKEMGAEIGFVFIHDGVIGISKKSASIDILVKLLTMDITFYALLPDIKARGIDPNYVYENIKKIDYENLVDLLINNSRIISWL